MMDEEYTIEQLIEYAKNGLGLLHNHKPSIPRLAEELGVERVTIYRWLNGKSVPSKRENYEYKLELLADYWVDCESLTRIVKRKLRTV